MEIYKNLADGGINIHIASGSSVSMHRHDFFELAYVTKGTALHLLNGKERLIEKGNYFIMDYNAYHHYIKHGNAPFEIINCLFLGEFIDPALKNKKDFYDVVNSYMLKYSFTSTNLSPANDIFRDENGEVFAILQDMLKECAEKKPGYKEILRAKLIEIIIQTMRKDNAILPETEDSLCQKITDYTKAHLTDKNCLTALSQKLCYSTAYLSKYFKEKNGICFSESLQKMRIEYALRLLAGTDMKITEIASECGYADTKFFNTVFKKQTGLTPREYRKQSKIF